MKDLVDMLMGYRTWVKIVVIALIFTIVVLLVFFRPEKQLQEDKDREALVAILQLRFETISNELNSVFENLAEAGKKNDVQATAEMVKLRDLRERFRKLHEKHVVAVAKDEILLAHDLVREIHTLLAQIEATVRAREGTIARDWFGSLPNAYLRTPEERDDPEYHAVMRDVGRLSEATVDRVQGLRYPGSPPQSVRAELRALAFESGD